MIFPRFPIAVARARLLLIVLAAGLTALACGPSEADRAAEASAKAAQQAADTAARKQAADNLEAERVKALWTYANVPAGKGHQLSAAINSNNDVETGGDAARRVMLVFRDHPAWGRSSYLVLNNGDFGCAAKCTVTVTADDGAPTSMAAHRPDTHEAIAIFVNDSPALWGLTTGAKRLSVAFAAKGGATRTATFDVGGLDPSKMPGWTIQPSRQRLQAPLPGAETPVCVSPLSGPHRRPCSSWPASRSTSSASITSPE